MKKSLLIILSALFLLMTACQDGTSPSSGTAVIPSADEPTGSISVEDIEAGTTAITLSGSMDAGYSVFLKSIPTDGSDTIVENIPAGDWIFFLNFTDSYGDVIGYGTKIVTVPENGTAVVSCNFGVPAAAPGEANFQDVLDVWFDAIFDAYGVPEDAVSDGLLIREGTSYLFNMLLMPVEGSEMTGIELLLSIDFSICDVMDFIESLSGEICSENVPADRCGGDDLPIELPDVDWGSLYNEIFFTFQLNMLYYYNMLVFDILPPTLSGITVGETIDSDQTVTMTAGVALDPVCDEEVDLEILWYLNGFYIGYTNEDIPNVDVNMADALAGENTLTAAVTYQGYALGMASVDFLVEEINSGAFTVGNFRDTVNSELGTYLINNGFAEGNDVLSFTGRMHIDGVHLDLTGIYEFSNLTQLWLTDTGFTLTDAGLLRSADDSRGLDQLESFLLWQSSIPQDVPGAVESAVDNNFCVFNYRER